MMQIEK